MPVGSFCDWSAIVHIKKRNNNSELLLVRELRIAFGGTCKQAFFPSVFAETCKWLESKGNFFSPFLGEPVLLACLLAIYLIYFFLFLSLFVCLPI